MKQFFLFLQYLLLFLLIVIMAFSNHPTIVRMSLVRGLESGTILSRYILILFAALFLVSVTRIPKLRCKLISRFGVCLFLILLIGLIIYAVHNNKEMLLSLRTFAIVFAAILIGWTLTPSEKHFSAILLVFGIAITFSGLMQVFTNIGGFVIEDQYLVDNKNSLGAMLASSVISFLYLAAFSKDKLLRFGSIVLAIIGVVIIITIRARSAMLATLLVSLFFFYLNNKNKKSVVLLILAVPAILLLFLFLPSSIIDYVSSSIFAGTQGEDVSSGRMGTYKLALDYFLQNPLMGDVEGRTKIPWVHNYLLLNLYQFGLLFSWPVLILYFYLLIHSIISIVKAKLSFWNLGYLVLLVPYIISLLEPTFPFGPGTVTVFNFILLGIAERFRTESLNKH